MLAGQLVSDLLRRVRDPQGTAHPRPVVLDLLNRAQPVFIRSTGTHLFERDFPVVATRLIYEIDATATLRVADLFDPTS